jgi:murein biosynthesis integral membrane protein MurJ
MHVEKQPYPVRNDRVPNAVLIAEFTLCSMVNLLVEKVRQHPVIRSSVGIIVVTMGVKMLGYAEKMVLAYYFGTHYQVDVYNLVIAIVLSVFIFFREIIEPGFLTSFIRAIREDNPAEAWSLFNTVGRYLLLITLGLTVLVFFFPEKVIDVFAPGFTGEKRALSVQVIRVAFPACIFLVLSALTNITLNSLKKFALPASADLAFKAAVLGALFLFYKYWGLYAAIAGVLAGAFFKLLIHLLALRKHLLFRKVPPVQPVYLRNAWQLTWPLLIGVSFSQLSALADNLFASYLQEGAISALSYARKVVDLPILVFPYILSIVVFPYFSELALARDHEKQGALLTQSLAWITLLFLPLSIFFFTFSLDIIEVMFMRGAFTQDSAALTAKPLAFYALGMVFFALETVLVIFYYANSNTRTPIFIGILCAVGDVLLSYTLINTIGYAGIALALAVSKAAKVIILLILLKGRIAIRYRSIWAFGCRVAVACVALALTLLAVNQLRQGVLDASTLEKALFLTAAFCSGGLVYALTLFVLKLDRSLPAPKAVLK